MTCSSIYGSDLFMWVLQLVHIGHEFITKKSPMHCNSYPDLSFFLLDSNQGGLLGNTDPAAEFPLKKQIITPFVVLYQ